LELLDRVVDDCVLSLNFKSLKLDTLILPVDLIPQRRILLLLPNEVSFVLLKPILLINNIVLLLLQRLLPSAKIRTILRDLLLVLLYLIFEFAHLLLLPVDPNLFFGEVGAKLGNVREP
jgi:hypothetical protein